MAATVRASEATIWQGRQFAAGQAITVRDDRLIAAAESAGFTVERSAEDRRAALASLRGKETSPEVASDAARLMKHPEAAVRRVAATALSQAGAR